MDKTIRSENWSVEIKSVRKLDEFEWHTQIEACEVVCYDPFTTDCCFWPVDIEYNDYSIRLFCGNIKKLPRDLDPSRIWIVDTEWKWEGESKKEKEYILSMVFYEDPDTPIGVPEDIVEILRETPVNHWWDS